MVELEVRPVERHPLDPFLPEGCRLLMLGSFPPERRRWSMEFFYPNFNNDMWRIMGTVFYGDRDRFVVRGGHRFDRDGVMAFCAEHGIGLYDTASEVRRLAGNASDKFLEVVAPTDVRALLRAVPWPPRVRRLPRHSPQQWGVPFPPLEPPCSSISAGDRCVSTVCLPRRALIRWRLNARPPFMRGCSVPNACCRGNVRGLRDKPTPRNLNVAGCRLSW